MKGINIHQGYSIATYFYYEAIQFHLIIALISPKGIYCEMSQVLLSEYCTANCNYINFHE